MTGLALLERLKSDESSWGSITILIRPSAKIVLELQPREWGVWWSADFLVLFFEVVLFWCWSFSWHKEKTWIPTQEKHMKQCEEWNLKGIRHQVLEVCGIQVFPWNSVEPFSVLFQDDSNHPLCDSDAIWDPVPYKWVSNKIKIMSVWKLKLGI